MSKNVNGDIYSDLITMSSPRNFGTNGSRALSSVKYIVIHGTANTSLAGTLAGWSVADDGHATGRQASANYVVDDNDIAGAVGENYSAWHCGGTGAITNQNSIGIEHVNSSIGDYADASTYLFSDKTLDNGARLTADICKRLGIVPSAQTIVPHRAVYATACPQTLNMDNYIKRVQAYYNNNLQAEEIIEGALNNMDYTLAPKSGKFPYVVLTQGAAIPVAQISTISAFQKAGAKDVVVDDGDYQRIIAAINKK